MTTEITVSHNGVAYSGQVMRIKRTSLGWEDHGILTAMLHCEAEGSGVSVGGFSLDRTLGKDADYTREGTAYGLDHLMQIMKTAGVSTWESLPGKDIVVLYEKTAGGHWGLSPVGFAGLLNDKVFILADHAKAWESRLGAAS